MQSVIWKYPIEIVGAQDVEMPCCHEILHVAMQNGKLCLWAQVDPKSLKTDVRIVIVGTGNPMPSWDLIHLGTVQDGDLIWHVFAEDIPF